MGQRGRVTIDIKSQDMDGEDLEHFRGIVVENSPTEGRKCRELIILSAGSRPREYTDLAELRRDWGDREDRISYLYYSLNWPGTGRVSLYLDPDRPGKIVIEGNTEWGEGIRKNLSKTFSKGDIRFVIHDRWGFLIIWGIIITMAIVALTVTTLVRNERDPVMTAAVLLAAGFLGTYISLFKAQDLHPANTISMKGKKNWKIDALISFLIVALGIVCAILVTLILHEAM